MSDANSIVLCYGDIVLRQYDVELLEGPDWLNDTVIEFWLEFLTRCRYKEYELCLFIGPGVTHCLKGCKTNADMGLFLDPLNAREKNIIFFVFNDHAVFDSVGGDHWSLLVYSKAENVICHYDSIRGNNREYAKEFAKQLHNYFQPGMESRFHEAPCLEQNNGYDCGIFVLCQAENVMNNFLKEGTILSCPMLSKTNIVVKRSSILQIIKSLKN